MEKPVTLEQLFPDHPEFSLKSTGKTYQLRLITLEDQVWIKANLGGHDEIRAIFESMDWEKLVKLIYRLMADKSDFLSREEKQVNDDGDLVTVKMTGPFLLLKAITGIEEGIGMLGALNRSMAASSPIVEEYLRKEMEQEVKKNRNPSRVGAKSSTSSRRNTATR